MESDRVTGVMEVITLSSESEEDDSDVEIVAQYSNMSRADPLRHQEDAPNVTAPGVILQQRLMPRKPRPQYIDLTGSKGILSELTTPIKPVFDARSIVDLTGVDTEIKEADVEIQKVCSHTKKQENSLQTSPSADVSRSTLQKNSELKTQNTQNDEELSPFVKLERLPFIEDHITEIKQLSCFVYLSKGYTLMSLQPRQQDATSEEGFSHSFLRMSTPAHLKSSSQVNPTPTHEHESGRHSERRLEVDNLAEDSNSVTLIEMVEDLGMEDTVCVFQKGREFEEQENNGGTFPVDLCIDAEEGRDFVYPFALEKLISGEDEALLMDISLDGEALGPPEEMCHQTLTLVYSTIEENHTEGTLQLLSDLLQPGYYPPKDITFHLLHDILLGPDCPYHQCVQAFHLLIRAQRHHPADINTVPWDWDLLTSVMTDKENPNKRKCKVVRMFLEYVVRTLEDDFHAKGAVSALHHSISKATLSCNRQFHHVRDLLKWLCSAITKSTESEESKKPAGERDEHLRLVSVFQRMLSLALKVDRCPTLHSNKVSEELFIMLFDSSFRREHRILLLESLRSKWLRCKLLNHMLDYVCSVKTPLPASPSLLLHFMRNCVPLQNPTEGAERGHSWEELVHLLWMFLHSYNNTIKGYLSQSVMEERSCLEKGEIISKTHVCEAIKTLLARAQVDLGQALPDHVEETLHFLRDGLLDVCQG